jgi:tryptophan 2,3-dioxygenase
MDYNKQPEVLIKEIQFDVYDKNFARSNPSLWFGTIVKAYADTHKEELKDDKVFEEKMDWLTDVAFRLSYRAFNRPFEVMELLKEVVRLEDRTPEWKKKFQNRLDTEREVSLDEQEGFDPSTEVDK